jgi:hypothetical protein
VSGSVVTDVLAQLTIALSVTLLHTDPSLKAGTEPPDSLLTKIMWEQASVETLL